MMFSKVKEKKSAQDPDPKFRVPRMWSNRELERFASFFSGSVVNVSAWNDEDKEGRVYRDYFIKAAEYRLTNFASEQKGWQGVPGEIFLDLEKDLPPALNQRFDVVFNHTTLEHIFECRTAFRNLCLLSKDVVIVVVPYLQQIHGASYEDFWRFTPHSMKRMYEENGLKMRYCSANGEDKASIYLFCIGYRDSKWDAQIPERFDLKLKRPGNEKFTDVIGANVVTSDP